jgi:hypothetical protein
MKRLLTGSLLGLLTLAASTASAQVYPERIAETARARAIAAVNAYQRRDRGDDREQATERTTKTFRLGASGSLSLGNIAGDIVVSRAGGSDTTVEIVKTARGRDAADAKDLLQIVTVDVVERSGRAELKAHYPSGDEMKRTNRRNLNVSIAYTVTAPPGTQVSVETISGNVKITDIKGDLSAVSISGDVRIAGGGRVGTARSISGNVEVIEAQVDGPLEAKSVSGDVTLRKIAARRVQAESVSGNLHLEDIQSDRVEGHTTSGDIGFAGTLARNGRYELKGFSGEVRVALSGNVGFELDASTVSGTIQSSDFPITTRGRMNRRTLTGTYGDGSAILDLSTFSGSIIITRR